MVTKPIIRVAKMIPFESDMFVPIVATRVTKDEGNSVSANGSAETSRSLSVGDRVRDTAAGNRLRHLPERPRLEPLFPTEKKETQSSRAFSERCNL